MNLNDYLPEDVTLANADDANVTIRLKVEQLTTRMIALGESDISMENGADYYHYHLSPARIEVKLQGLKEDLDTLKATDLKAAINLSGMQLGAHNGTLSMSGLGKNFNLISVSAFTVEVTAGGPAAQMEQQPRQRKKLPRQKTDSESDITKSQDTETDTAQMPADRKRDNMVSRKIVIKNVSGLHFAQPGCFAMKPSSTNHPLNFILAMPHPTQKVFSACSEPASNAATR